MLLGEACNLPHVAMTLAEFLMPLDGKTAQRDLLLAAMYYMERYESRGAVTTGDIKGAFQRARHAKGRAVPYAAVLSQAAPFVDAEGKDGRHILWTLTETGRERVRGLLNLPAAEPEVEHEVGTLQALAAGVADEGVRGYVEEAVKCLQVGALRSSVVFLWTGAVATVRDRVWEHGAPAIDAALKKGNPKARDFRKKDDFAYVKDSELLQVAQDLGVLDKTQKGVLGQGLDLRNSCGHPTKYHPRIKRVSAFLEDVIGIVWPTD
jgi:hypothetical protein